MGRGVRGYGYRTKVVRPEFPASPFRERAVVHPDGVEARLSRFSLEELRVMARELGVEGTANACKRDVIPELAEALHYDPAQVAFYAERFGR